MLRRKGSWVSKTDMTRYVRCPYAFWLLDGGLISFSEMVDEFQGRLLAGGRDFETVVNEAAMPVVIEPGKLGRLLRRDVRLLGTPEFANRKLRLRGRPDGIDAASGAVVPIEIKSHKSVQRLDELELAFYWLLLEPYRTVRNGTPRGLLVLRRDGQPHLIEVPISQHRLDEVMRLVAEIRTARRRGVRPRVCGCHVCSVTRRQEVRDAVQANRDLTMIFGIGPGYAGMLEAAGIATWEDLLGRKQDELAGIARGAGIAQTARWRLHARSYQSAAPLVSATTFPIGESFIALDLEYGPHIWLAGACVISGDTREYVALWADEAAEEQRNLQTLSSMVCAHPSLPVITWAGHCADIPELRKAADRSPTAGPAIQEVLKRHADLYLFARDHVRLPIPGLGLREVAAYFGIPRISEVTGGFQAQMMYREYQHSGDFALRDRLTDYNRDDLDALVGVALELNRLVSSAPGSSATAPAA
jgi:predicted RecB family nuclease